MKQRAERSKQAVQTAGLYVFQHAHRLGNAIQNLYRIANSIRLAPDEELRNTRIKQLEAIAEDYIDQLNRVFNLGETIQNPAQEPIPRRHS